MAKLRIEKPCEPVDIDDAKRAIEDYCSAIGYEYVDDDEREISFKFPRGQGFSPHALKVVLTGTSMLCEFGGWMALEKSREDFERITKSIARAVDVVAGRAKQRKKRKRKPKSKTRHVDRTIERQVVVTRCKFCKQLTPVDLEACKNCGAPKFC